MLRPGGMGDLILLVIACEEAGLDPRRMLWVIEQRSEVWARHMGLEYLCYDSGLPGLLLKTAGRYRTVMNSEQRFGLSQAVAVAARSRGGRLFGFDSNTEARWSDRVVHYDPDRAHEVTEFSRLLGSAFGTAEELRPRRRRKEPATGPRMVGLGGLQIPQRAFPLDQWERFLRAWAGTEEFVLSAAPVDRAFGQELVRRFPGQASLFEGGFGDLCGAISRSREIFTVDGGFVHMASYYGVPVTAVFTSGRDGKWAPIGEGSVVVRRRDLDCQPCTWFGQVPECRHHHACKDVSVEERLVRLG